MAFDHFRRVCRHQTDGRAFGETAFAQGAGKPDAPLIGLSPRKSLTTVYDRLAVRPDACGPL